VGKLGHAGRLSSEIRVRRAQLREWVTAAGYDTAGRGWTGTLAVLAVTCVGGSQGLRLLHVHALKGGAVLKEACDEASSRRTHALG
jgi:hypothetical protein